jgi:hypothetical protein
MTTVPTAISPSRLERLDSKYIARMRQSRPAEFAATLAVSPWLSGTGPVQPCSHAAPTKPRRMVRVFANRGAYA